MSGASGVRSGPGALLRPLFLLAIALWLSALAPASSKAETPLRIEWKDNRLSIYAERVPRAEILREVALKTGAQIRGSAALKGEASMNFSSLPLAEGLRRLLGSSNFAIIERPAAQGGATQVSVIIMGDTGQMPQQAAQPAPEGGEAVEPTVPDEVPPAEPEQPLEEMN